MPHPFSTLSPIAGRDGRVVDTMTDLVLIAAILELIASAVHLAAAIIEKLPVRKDEEQH